MFTTDRIGEASRCTSASRNRKNGAADVDRHVLVEVFYLPLGQRKVADDRRVVHEPVDGPEAVDRLGHDPARALGQGEVDCHAVGLTARFLHGFGAHLEQLGPAPDQHEVSARGTEA